MSEGLTVPIVRLLPCFSTWYHPLSGLPTNFTQTCMQYHLELSSQKQETEATLEIAHHQRSTWSTSTSTGTSTSTMQTTQTTKRNVASPRLL